MPHTLGMELMQVDRTLKTKQAFWETPRNTAFLPATVATVAGLFGYKIGAKSSRPIIVQRLPAPVPAAH